MTAPSQVRRFECRAVRRLTSFSFVMHAKCMCRIVHGTFAHMNYEFEHYWMFVHSSARASPFLFSSSISMVHTTEYKQHSFRILRTPTKPLPTKWLMIISYISICSSVWLISREYTWDASVQTIFIDRPSVHIIMWVKHIYFFSSIIKSSINRNQSVVNST